MARLFRLADHQAKNLRVHFDRNELMQLLGLYARRVAEGGWRDYAIDQGGGRAAFSVYRHTHDRPLFTVTKETARTGEVEYSVANGERELTRSDTLADVLGWLERVPRLVPAEIWTLHP